MYAKNNKSEKVNVPGFMTAFTLDVLGSNAFGYQFDNVKALADKELGRPTDTQKLGSRLHIHQLTSSH
jgi:hypothetical protein